MHTIGIEIGNSRIKLGAFRNRRLFKVYFAQTENAELLKIPGEWEKINPERIGLSSVVPSINQTIKRIFSKFYGKDVFIVKPSDCGISLEIDNPESVGVDRVLNCRAGLELFGSPIIVVDVGTAITIDSATKIKGFTGGSIMPGAGLWMRALITTSMIKEGKMVRTGFPARNTDQAISSGIKYGIPGAINSVISEALKKYPSARIILTGGGSTESVCRRINFKIIRRKYLTLEGIGFILDDNKTG